MVNKIRFSYNKYIQDSISLKMIIACWSGPRNISTALMRSWSSRRDTIVIDEPFYAYYLKKTKKNHPMRSEIVNHYSSDYEKVVHYLTHAKSQTIKIFAIKNIWHII